MKKSYYEWMDTISGQNLQLLNTTVESFLKEFHSTMKRKNFDRLVAKQSALYHWQYRENGLLDRNSLIIEISGWHGTGKPGTNRFYGAGKSFFTMYSRKSATEKIVDWDHHDALYNTFQELVEAQKKVCNEALAHIRTL